MVVATVAMAEPEGDLPLMLAVVVALGAIAALVVVAVLFLVALVKPVPLALVEEEAVVAAVATRIPLDLVVVSACLVRALTVLAAPVPQTMVLAALGDREAGMLLKQVQLRQVTSTEQVSCQLPAFMAAVVVALTIQLLNKVTVVLALSASYGGPIGLSLVLTLVTCNSHGY